MKPGFVAPRGTLEAKPKHGEPCNRCGLCCYAVQCPLSEHVFGRRPGPCPVLTGTIGDAGCGLVADPMRYSMRRTLQHGVEAMRAAALLLIGSGTGCDARMNGEQPDQSFYAKLRRWDQEHRVQVRAARRLWGME